MPLTKAAVLLVSNFPQATNVSKKVARHALTQRTAVSHEAVQIAGVAQLHY